MSRSPTASLLRRRPAARWMRSSTTPASVCYAGFAQRICAGLTGLSDFTRETDVAQAVWRAVNDASGQLRFRAGADALKL